MQLEYPDKSIEFVRCIAECNLVALHSHQTWPGNDQYVTMYFFRFDENEKICKHWDSIQQIPKTSFNPQKCNKDKHKEQKCFLDEYLVHILPVYFLHL
ncbi:MAG: putative SnoaL-like aldol condensation-catalyzing enzyme [Arcticibacterium sp.]|jgi:predicted SnoaL-like aldol condensation-catalyzing enzyme